MITVGTYQRGLDKVRKLLPGGVHSCIDIGPGIYPQQVVEADEHFCLEPCSIYADKLGKQYNVICEPWQKIASAHAFLGVPRFELAVALDVIEHLEEEEGREALRATAECSDRILLYTPMGFFAQDCGVKDAWGLKGGEWQVHRSGWTPETLEAALPGRWEFVVIVHGIRARWNSAESESVPLPPDEWQDSFFSLWTRSS